MTPTISKQHTLAVGTFADDENNFLMNILTYEFGNSCDLNNGAFRNFDVSWDIIANVSDGTFNSLSTAFLIPKVDERWRGAGEGILGILYKRAPGLG